MSDASDTPRPDTRSHLVLMRLGDRVMSVSEWARQPEIKALGLGYASIRYRHEQGWSDYDALTLPMGARLDHGAIDPRVPWLEDYTARAFVVHHPEGATLEEVGQMLGVTRERVRQIEVAAFKRLRRACEREGIDAEDLAAIFGRDEAQSLPSHERPQRPRPSRAAPPPPPEELLHSAEAIALDAAIERLARAADRLAALMGIDVPEVSP